MRRRLLLVSVLLLAVRGGAADPFAAQFDYDRRRPTALHEVGRETRAEALVRDVTYIGTEGAPVAAYLVTPARRPRHTGAAVLFVHWYAPEEPTSNRTQFLDEAAALAADGATSLLIETMWSRPDWFPKRDPNGDVAASVRQVRELRRALDVLLAQPRVDRRRVAFVGHDFGAMYGTLLATVDRRATVYALQAGAPQFSDWFLLGRKLDAAARQAVIDALAPLDPVRHIGQAAPAPVLFQFGRKDPYVPPARADAFVAAAREPKEVRWYDTGHGLNAAATEERLAWLRERLR